MRAEEVMLYVSCRIPTSEDESLIERQCARACERINALVKDEADVPEILLREAAAALTVMFYFQYKTADSGSGAKSFKAGDVSVTESAADFLSLQKQAEKDYHSCLVRLAPYLSEEAASEQSEPFFFMGVGGCRFH